MLQGLVGHHRAEVRAADADVDDGADALAGVPLPGTGADAVGEVGHLIEHGVDLRHDVRAVHDDGGALRGAEGDVQDDPLLGDVDLVTAEHGVDVLAPLAPGTVKPGRLGKADFQIDPATATVSCPAGQVAPIRTEPKGHRRARFPKAGCDACDLRERCVSPVRGDRNILPYNCVKFDASGQSPEGQLVMLQVQKGQFVTVWPAEVAAAAPVYPVPGWSKR